MNNTDPSPAKTLFQGLWHGPPMGAVRQACLSSFVDMGHAFDLYVYEEVEVPDGVNLCDANDIIPFEDITWYSDPGSDKRDISPFSDVFRFKLLSDRGGWWSDVDTVCLSRDIPPVVHAWAQEKPEFQPHALGTSQIAFPAGDPVVHELYRRALEMTRRGFPLRESTGPILISDVIAEHGLPKNQFGTADTFYPLRWIEMFKPWLPEFTGEIHLRCRDALFLPIFFSFPGFIGLSGKKLPPQGSYLSDLCHRYLGDLGNAKRFDDDDVRKGTHAYLLKNEEWAMTELLCVSDLDSLNRLGLGRGLRHLLPDSAAV